MSNAEYEARRARDGTAILCLRKGSEIPSDLNAMDWNTAKNMLAPPPHIVRVIEMEGYYLTGSPAAEASWQEAAVARPMHFGAGIEGRESDQEVLSAPEEDPPASVPDWPTEPIGYSTSDPPSAEPPADDEAEYDRSASIFRRVWPRRQD